MPASDIISTRISIKNLGRHCYQFGSSSDMITRTVWFQVTWLHRDFENLSGNFLKGCICNIKEGW